MSRTFTFPSAEAAYGIRCFLHNNSNIDFKVIEKGKKLNLILVEYLKNKGIRYVKFNPRYKGLNTADLENSLKIQEDFKSFREWIKENYNKI